MKDKKEKKDKKGKNAQKGKKEAHQETPGCLSFGKLDLIYKIEFNEKDLENGDKPYNIEDINSIKDLSFIKERKNIWDKIIVRPNNATLEQLLIGNKISKKKMNLEYIGYGCPPNFEGDEEFFQEIYEHVNEKNHININKKPLIEDGPYSLKFELIYKDKTHTFCIGSGGDDDKKEEEKKEEEKKEEEKKEEEKKEEEKKEEEKKEGENTEKKEEKKEEEKTKEEKKKEEETPDEYEPNEAMKEDKIPKFSRKDSVLCNLYTNCKKYSLFYLNFDELKNIPGNFEKRDLIELLYFFKKKGIKIFINYYQPEEEKKEEKEEEGNKNKDNEVAGETYDSSGKVNEKEKERKKEKKEEGDGESKE